MRQVGTLRSSIRLSIPIRIYKRQAQNCSRLGWFSLPFKQTAGLTIAVAGFISLMARAFDVQGLLQICSSGVSLKQMAHLISVGLSGAGPVFRLATWSGRH